MSANPAPSARRSCLSVPGSSASMLAKAPLRGADEVIIDLEDAVATSAKDEARDTVVAALQEPQYEGVRTSRPGQRRAHAVVSLRHHRDGLGAGPAGHDHRAEGRERRRPGVRRAPARRRRGRRRDRRAAARAGADRDRRRRRAARRDRRRLGAAGLADPRLRGPVGVARPRCGCARRARLVAIDPGRDPRRRAHARRRGDRRPVPRDQGRRGLHRGGRARPRHGLRRQVGDPPRAGRGAQRAVHAVRRRRSSTRAP